MSILGKMMHKGAALLPAAGIASSLAAQDVAVPSGAKIALFDVIIEAAPPVARFRFVAPQIGTGDGSLGFEDVADDIQYLCDDIARPALLDNDWREGQIVISLSGQETAFGEPAPDVTQFFQPFTLSADRCIWEDF